MDMAALMDHRRRKDDIFRGHHSPLHGPARVEFGGLAYYDPSPDLVYRLEIEPADGTRVVVHTSDGREEMHERAGVARFDVAGEEVTLTLYDTGHPGYFLPFRDATSGTETYGAGRYLDLDRNPDGTLLIDFNLAYNPLCAYNDSYSCPLPPIENWLSVPIRAGEKDFSR